MAKKIIVNFFRVLAGILALLGVYALLSLLIPYIEIAEKPTSDPQNIPIYIYTNGVHTDLVMPIKNAQFDWSQKIPYDNTVSKATDYQYVGIGWGDKGFYLDTPTWADLKVSTALKAAFWLGESAMHTTFYYKMTEAEDCKKIMVSEKQYAELVQFVDDKFEKNNAGQNILIPTNAVYSEADAFYEANGSYSFANTCNTWTNNALKVADQKAALWTPTDFGIFQHYK